MLPMLLVYALHYLAASPDHWPTGFLQYDQAYYMANAKAVFSNGFSFTYGLPFSPSDATPRVYFQPLILLLGIVLKLTASNPGAIYVGCGILAGVAMFRAALAVCFEYLGKPSGLADWLACLLVLWGGGIVFLSGFTFALALGIRGPLLWHDAFAFDPFQGLWFLNLGRNVFYTTEAFYHLVFLGTVLLVIRRRYGWALAAEVIAASSHPFTGLELILIVGADATVSRVLDRENAPPLWFLVGTLGVLSLHLAYYLLLLPWLSPEYRVLDQQWSLPWTLPGLTMVVAYGPVLVLALVQLRRQWFADRAVLRQPKIRLAVIWCVVALLLANHELFIPPRQPLHFTHGYIWTPLALLALPLLRDVLRHVLNIRPRVVGVLAASSLMIIAALDNIAWFGVHYANTLNDRNLHAIYLTADQRAVLHRLAAPDMRGRLLLSEDPLVGYLVTVYVPLRSWRSHRFNTPYSVRHKAELQALFATGTLIDPWRSRRLAAVVDTAADPDATPKLLADHFIVADRLGHDVILLRNPTPDSGRYPATPSSKPSPNPSSASTTNVASPL